ncbi:MAG: MlaD family protein [Rhodospirillum sp.]|nr:MlaD family protein [Rhodospirillum sp.]MCF8488669.1 MlaD family protein [Rhodospirillum sp.]
MNASRANHLIVGIFVLAMIIGIIVAASMISGHSGSTDTYYATYSNVGGIKYGTQVLYEGYRVGQVEEITPSQTPEGTTFRLELSVQEGWHIPEGSTATIAASGLLAAVTIDIKGGEGKDLIAPGSEIPSGAGGGMFAALGDIASEFNGLSQEGLRPLLAKLNTYADILGTSMTESVPSILKDARAVTDAMADRMPSLISRVDEFTRRLNDEVLSNKNVEQINTSIDDLAAFTGDLAALGAQLKGSGDGLNKIVRAVDGIVDRGGPQVDASLRDLRHTLRTLSTSIDTITFNLEGATRDLKEFSRVIRQNPGTLLRGGSPEEKSP